jgi:hypothetical protein
MTATNLRPRIESLVGCLALAALAIVGIAAAIAPTANAAPKDDRTLTQSFSMDDLNIFDLQLTTACGTEVDALLSFTQERKLVLGTDRDPAAHETMTVKGEITWYAPETGKTYSDKLDSRSRIDYPQGVADWPAPAHVTVTGRNGGTFPYEGYGFPGNGRFEYDAQIYSTDWDGFPYSFPLSEPDWTRHGFERATEKICAALT